MSFVRELLKEFADRDYTPADVLSKVSAAEKQATNYENTKKFGLQDTDGNVIIVYVAADQSDDFEDALGLAMANMQEDSATEIAEILFNMQDRFNIVNVEWPSIQEDEEQDATDSEDIVADDPESELPSEDGEMPEELDAAPEAPQDNAAVGALDAVVSMMAADAEAKRQEALARAAEARAREAEAAAKIADGKLRAEEEVADMEAFYNSKNEEQKEAKKLAKLAKYRHEVKSQDNEQDAMDYADALASQERESGLGMDTAGRESESGDPLSAGIGGGAEAETENDAPTNDLDTELQDFGVENEEDVTPDGPGNVNRRFREIEDTIKYLHSLQVRKQVHNN